ncbi:hypothetical protein OAE19_03535 [Porticoccaceae bacterium]|jgi:hypothetical protein|nr:hypothetical protein [Porticoccaceae bacterium]MDC0003448.1 hypothetical protein [Porticoccaceae bacterium]
MVAKLSHSIRYVVFAAVFGLLLIPAAQGEPRGPIQVTTDIGAFLIPRQFVAIDLWKTLKIPPFETNYFVFRLPSKYVEAKISGFTAIENHFEQEVIVTVEVLTKKRHAMLEGIDSRQCRQENHDLYPQSVPYRRCEYRKYFSPGGIAIKYQLNGENNQQFRYVEALAWGKLNEWKMD